MSSAINPPHVGQLGPWYSDRGSLSGEERARIEAVDAVLKPLDDPEWSYWPSWAEAIESGKHGTEQELRSKPSKIAWSETRPMTEVYPQIPPDVQTTIQDIFPLKKIYEIGLVDHPQVDKNQTPTCTRIPLVYLLGDKDGKIAALSPDVRQSQQKLPWRGGAFRHMYVCPVCPVAKHFLLAHWLITYGGALSMFPLTKYDWLMKLPYMFQEANLGNLSNAPPLVGFTEQGIYNDFLKPQLECQPRVGTPSRITISIPIISVKDGKQFRDQKTAERCIRSLPTVVRAPGYEGCRDFKGADGKIQPKPPIWNWTRPFDDPGADNPGDPMKIYSGRSLFEYRYPRQETNFLDLRQTVRKHGIRGSPGLDSYVCVDQMWAVIFLTTDNLVTFQQLLSVDSAVLAEGTGAHHFEPSRGVQMAPAGPVHGFLLFFADLTLKSHYCIIDSFRDATSNINFRVSSNPVEDEELIQDCNSLLTELSILIEVTNTQLEILAGVKGSALDGVTRTRKTDHTVEFYNSLTERLVAVRGTFEEHQLGVKQAQNLLFQLLITENVKQQAKMSAQQAEIAEQTAKETAMQVRMAERTEEQSKSVLVFTIITTVFLPLSFFTSYYGMSATNSNLHDASDFWRIAGPASLAVVILAMTIAFRGRLKTVATRILSFKRRPGGADPSEYDASRIEKGERDLPKKHRNFWGWSRGQKND